MSECVGS